MRCARARAMTKLQRRFYNTVERMGLDFFCPPWGLQNILLPVLRMHGARRAPGFYSRHIFAHLNVLYGEMVF